MHQIWLIRHGVTRANRLGIIQGQSDEPLSDHGRAQARALGAWLADHGFTADQWISSPLSRAAETASIVAGALAVDPDSIERDARLAERSFGDLEGEPAAETYALQAATDDPATWRPPNGESYADLDHRVRAGFAAVGERSGERAAVFSHGGPIRAAICAALDMPFVPASFARLRVDNTSVTIFERRRQTADRYAMLTINARFHL